MDNGRKLYGVEYHVTDPQKCTTLEKILMTLGFKQAGETNIRTARLTLNPGKIINRLKKLKSLLTLSGEDEIKLFYTDDRRKTFTTEI